MSKPKAYFVGNPKIGETIQKVKPEWEFVGMSNSIADFAAKLNSGEVENDIQIILILDSLFSVDASQSVEFERFVAVMAPYCFLGIINYMPEHKELMRQRIEAELYSVNASESLYYFLPKASFLSKLDEAIREFIKNSGQEYNVAVLSGRNVDSLKESYEEEEEEDWDDEIDGKLGKVIACTSSKGGSGKSTIAVALATFLAHSSIQSVKEGLEPEPLKVVVLDLDVRDGQLGFLTNETGPTIRQLVQMGISESSIEETAIYNQRLKVDLLLAPKKPRHSDSIPSEFYSDLINQLRRMYDFVILDTSVNYLDPLLEEVAYPKADQIIFVTDIVVNSIFSMTRWIQEVRQPKHLGGSGINPNKIGIVVNKALANVNMTGEDIQKAILGLPLLTIVPSSPKLIAHSANNSSMQNVLTHEAIYTSIRRLANAVVGDYKLSPNLGL